MGSAADGWPAARPEASGGQLGAALAAPGSDDCPAGAGAHPVAETVRLGATPIVGLEGALAHVGPLPLGRRSRSGLSTAAGCWHKRMPLGRNRKPTAGAVGMRKRPIGRDTTVRQPGREGQTVLVGRGQAAQYGVRHTAHPGRHAERVEIDARSGFNWPSSARLSGAVAVLASAPREWPGRFPTACGQRCGQWRPSATAGRRKGPG